MKPVWIALTDLRKISRERRTIALTIVLPVIVVIVVGTTFSLGYQEFEGRETAVGVIRHGNSTYSEMILEAVRDQNAEAILYDTLDEANEDLVRERIDTVIEVDPWINEKMAEFKRSWIAIHADETRPLLTAAIEVVMLQATQAVVDEIVWQYVGVIVDDAIPEIVQALDRLESMVEGGEVDAMVEDALAALGALASVDDASLQSLVAAAEGGFEEIVVNGTSQQKLILSMLNRSAVIGTLRSVSDSKPLLDSLYHFLRYVQPHLDEPGVIPYEALEDLSAISGNLTQVKPSDAAIIAAALPLLRGRLLEAVAEEYPGLPPGEVERKVDSVLLSASQLMTAVADRGEEIGNLSRSITQLKVELEGTDPDQLAADARKLLASVGGMEEGFPTSPIYMVERPLYFGDETRRYVDYISPGIFAFGILFSVLVYTVLSVVRDREKGILRRVFICNVDRWTYVGGKVLICLAIAAIQIIVLTTCAILIFDVYVANVPKTFLFGLYSSIGFVGVGLLISSVSKTELEALTASFGLIFIMLMISGIFYPFELSPSIIRQASAYVPITYVADLLKAGMIKDASLSEASADLVAVGIYGGATLLIGTLGFRWRKKG
jgi:ABC-type multidrug transport system permease subunit